MASTPSSCRAPLKPLSHLGRGTAAKQQGEGARCVPAAHLVLSPSQSCAYGPSPSPTRAVGALVGSRVVEAREAVDLAPWHAPAAPVALEPADGAVEGLQLLGAAQRFHRVPHIVVRRPAVQSGRPELIRPEAGQGGGLRRG